MFPFPTRKSGSQAVVIGRLAGVIHGFAAEAYIKLRVALEPRRTLRDLHVAQFGRSSRAPMCVIE
jgi:hypothetical protein